MLNHLITSILVGTVLGFLSGLGIGGGSLLIIWLTVILEVDPLTARTINLLFFIPSALTTCIIRIRRQELPWQSLLPAILAGCIAAWFFSTIFSNMDLGMLKKLFGTILICTGLREIHYRPRKAR